jgi:AcrR family transcriptional regulator
MPTEVSRDAVLEAAARAIAQVQQPTMEELAAAAGVSLRTLYRLFGSRQELLRELAQEPPPSSRLRVLETAFELVGQHGLAELSMDDLASQAGVSRATLYRLFPGKSALFRALIQAYSPWEAIAELIEANRDAAPAELMPKIGHALDRALAGRTGLLLRMVFEMGKGDPDTAEGIQHSLGRGLPDLISYVSRQMAAGELRRMHPILALQLLAGPIVAHLITRPLAALIGFNGPQEEVVDQIVEAWLRTMTPDQAA